MEPPGAQRHFTFRNDAPPPTQNTNCPDGEKGNCSKVWWPRVGGGGGIYFSGCRERGQGPSRICPCCRVVLSHVQSCPNLCGKGKIQDGGAHGEVAVLCAQTRHVPRERAEGARDSPEDRARLHQALQQTLLLLPPRRPNLGTTRTLVGDDTCLCRSEKQGKQRRWLEVTCARPEKTKETRVLIRGDPRLCHNQAPHRCHNDQV